MTTVLIAVRILKSTQSGTPRLVLQHTRYLSNKGYKVYVVAQRINRKAIKAHGGIPVKVPIWPVKGYFHRKFFALQTRILQKFYKPDLTLGHGDIFDQDILYLHNCIHLAHELTHGKPLPQKNAVGQIHAKQLKEQKFKLLVCNSKMMQQDVGQRFGVPESKLKVIYPEHDEQRFTINEKTKEKRVEQRKLMGYDDRNVVISLITSGDFKKRNVQLLLDLIEILYHKHDLKHIRCFIAGKNKDSYYQQEVEDKKLKGIVTFQSSIPNVENYYFATDIFVLPAWIEEFGRSVVEAMACGLPVLVSERVGSSELLEGPSRNYILPPKVELYEHKIVELIKDGEKRKAIGQNNAETAAKYNSMRQNEKHNAVFISLADKA
ncbi:glycosyltransferase family 4 protein [Salinivirga cyanobacteriivorans]